MKITLIYSDCLKGFALLRLISVSYEQSVFKEKLYDPYFSDNKLIGVLTLKNQSLHVSGQ